MKHIKKIFPLVTMAAAGVFLYMGISEFGFWDKTKGPGGGFYPSLIAVILLALSLLAFVRSWKEEPPKQNREDFKLLLAAAALLCSSFVVGLMPAILLFLLLWMKAVEKTSWKQAMTLAVTVGGAAWLIFGLWLGVQFPGGILGL